MRKQVEMLKDHSDFAPHLVHLLNVVAQFDAVDDDASTLVLFEPIDAPDHCRLARTRRPADHDAFAAVHGKVDVLEGVELAKPLVHRRDLNDYLVGHGAVECVLNAVSRRLGNCGGLFGMRFAVRIAIVVGGHGLSPVCASGQCGACAQDT